MARPPGRQSTLEKLWGKEDAARQAVLEEARFNAKLTKPYVLRDQGATQDQRLQENYQSHGTYGVNILEGSLVAGLLPPLLPWFKQVPSAKVLSFIPAEAMELVEQELFRRDFQVQSVLESAGIHNQKRKSVRNLLILGDTLELMRDDFRIRVYRLDHYTTRRDAEGRVIFHMTREILDPLTLSDKQIEAIGLKKADLEGAHEGQAVRSQKLFTRVEWQPQSKVWLIEQECNGKIIPLGTLNEEKSLASEETVTPYISTPMELVDGEHYGHGFVEISAKADLRSLDFMWQSLLEWIGLAANVKPVIDEASTVRAEDLNQPSGYPIRCRMNENGKPKDIGFWGTEKLADIQIVRTGIELLQARVSKVMGIPSESVRPSERTTAFEIQKTLLSELDKSLAGMLPSITDHMVLPVVHRTIYQLERDHGLRPLPRDAVDVQILTGLAALAKSAKVQDLLDVYNLAKDFGPEGMAYIKIGGMLHTLSRYKNLYEPQVIRTDAEVDEEKKKQAEREVQQAAAQQAVETAGAVVQNRAAQDPPRS